MADLVGTCPKDFWLEWIAEGDAAGLPESGEEWGWYTRDILALQAMPGDPFYVVAHGLLRGWAPVVRVHDAGDSFVICRKGGAVACTIADPIPGFRGLRTIDGCGRPVGPGNIFYEHIQPDAISGRNDLDNAAVLTKTCWLIKSNGYDKPTIAKANRVRDNARGIFGMPFRPLIGTKASGVKKPLSPFARPIDRDTGREL